MMYFRTVTLFHFPTISTCLMKSPLIRTTLLSLLALVCFTGSNCNNGDNNGNNNAQRQKKEITVARHIGLKPCVSITWLDGQSRFNMLSMQDTVVPPCCSTPLPGDDTMTVSDTYVNRWECGWQRVVFVHFGGPGTGELRLPAGLPPLTVDGSFATVPACTAGLIEPVAMPGAHPMFFESEAYVPNVSVTFTYLTSDRLDTLIFKITP